MLLEAVYIKNWNNQSQTRARKGGVALMTISETVAALLYMDDFDWHQTGWTLGWLSKQISLHKQMSL